MREQLKAKLYEFITRNNPDLLMSTENSGGINHYIKSKVENAAPLWNSLRKQSCPEYIMEELCMDMLTRDLKPSRYHYLCALLETEFEKEYNRFRETGILTYEVVILIERCQHLFDRFDYRLGNEDNRQLYNAMTGTVKEYFDELKNAEDHGL